MVPSVVYFIHSINSVYVSPAFKIYGGEPHSLTPVYYLATTMFYKHYEEETATAFINLSP